VPGSEARGTREGTKPGVKVLSLNCRCPTFKLPPEKSDRSSTYTGEAGEVDPRGKGVWDIVFLKCNWFQGGEGRKIIGTLRVRKQVRAKRSERKTKEGGSGGRNKHNKRATSHQDHRLRYEQRGRGGNQRKKGKKGSGERRAI